MNHPPLMKRQYGSKHSIMNNKLSTSSSPAPSSSSSSFSTRKTIGSEWATVLGDANSSYIAADVSPPTSPSCSTSQISPTTGLAVKMVVKESSHPMPQRKDQGNVIGSKKLNNLFSFFKPVSPRKQRPRMNYDDAIDNTSADECKSDGKRRKLFHDQGGSSFASSSTREGPSVPSRLASRSTLPKSKTTTKATKLEQLYLDPYTTPGHSTLSCVTCSLSYSRTPQDIALHESHHRRVVKGCDWISASEERENNVRGSIVCQEGIEWGEGEVGGKIVMVEGAIEGAAGRKIKLVLATVDTSLSSTSLTSEQLNRSKIFIFLNSKRKVVACAVIERITEAYQVVGSKYVGTPDSDNPAHEDDKDLMQFGDEDGAVFCSPVPQPTLLGVHRIWTSPLHRRSSLATQLLDVAAARYIYGYPISRARRKVDIAFSQPTGDGMDFARSWTGCRKYKVFID